MLSLHGFFWFIRKPFGWPYGSINPKSVIRLHPYFVQLSGRLFSAFVEDVAGYIEKKRKTR